MKQGYRGQMRINTITADALAPFVARMSATMELTKQDKSVPAFQQDGFQLHVFEKW